MLKFYFSQLCFYKISTGHFLCSLGLKPAKSTLKTNFCDTNNCDTTFCILKYLKQANQFHKLKSGIVVKARNLELAIFGDEVGNRP